MKAAIVGLVRGFDNLERYSKLIRRNRLLHNNFNKRHGYPIVLFHEGNILLEHQQVMQKLTPNLQFVDVSGVAFTRPPGLKMEWMGKGTNGIGYKHMCRFNALQIWDFVSEYDYVMRLDDDSLIESRIDYDLFDFIKDRNLDYGYIHTEHDYHEQTIATLPQFTRAYIQTCNVNVNCFLADIDALYFYTNFFITRVSFWYQPEVQKFLHAVDRSLGIYQYRWGDHVIQAHVLKMFSKPEKMYQFRDFRYSHGSHSWSNYEPNRKDLFFRYLSKKLRRRFEPSYLDYLLKRSQASSHYQLRIR